MKLTHRFLSGEQFLPKPLIYQNPSEGLMILATSWGDQSAGQLVVDTILEEMNKIQENTEVTRVGKFVEPVASESQNLYQAIGMANSQVEKKFNNIEYSAGVELVVIHKVGQKIFWYQVGKPSLFIGEQEQIQPLSHVLSLSEQYRQSSYMPEVLLGLTEQVQINSGQIRFSPNRKIILLSRDFVSPRFFSSDGSDLEDMSRQLAKENHSLPFWIGQIEF